jgi:hypothetical protein
VIASWFYNQRWSIRWQTTPRYRLTNIDILALDHGKMQPIFSPHLGQTRAQLFPFILPDLNSHYRTWQQAFYIG